PLQATRLNRITPDAKLLLQPSVASSRKLTHFATEIVPNREVAPVCPSHTLPLSRRLVVACGQIRFPPERPMRGTMMDFPLTLPTILERSGKIFPRVEIVSRKPDKSILRTCYRDFYRRARRLAAALTKLGLQPGDRVASMMWNHAGHMEAFFGVPCAGGILHTLNLRLHPHEIAGIAKQAGDRFLLIDDVLLPLYEKFSNDVS